MKPLIDTLFLNITSYITWDPNPIMFTVPVIDRSVRYYGAFFVLGFILGYFIIMHMFKRNLEQTKTLLDRDIASWPELIRILRESAADPSILAITKKLSKKSREELESADPQKCPPQLKTAILSAINQTLDDPAANLSRPQLEKLFPKAIYTIRDLSIALTDKLTWFTVAGTIIGARLGHVFFYEWPRYQDNWIEILKVWEGGLASHGGAIGILIALYFYQRIVSRSFPEFSFIGLLDMLVVPVALAGCFIRIGNFFNQEIVGTETTLPWGVIFGHAADGSIPVPRHPVQIYEAIAYLLSFIFLFGLWQIRFDKLKPGTISGWFFILIFGSRFFLEFFKVSESLMRDESVVRTGQFLSIPFVIAGICLLFLGNRLNHKRVSSY